MTGYLTPDSVPSAEWCRAFLIPNSAQWLGVFMGALLPLTYPTSWTQYGELTPDECSEIMLDIIWRAYQEECGQVDIEAPFYDDEENVDDEEPLGEQTWYDSLSDWVISGFLAVTFTPAAAIAYNATIPRIRLAIKTGDAGTIIRVIFGSVDILYDTYAPTTSIEYIELDAASLPVDGVYPLRIEHTGTHNSAATPTVDGYYAQVVRGDIRPVAFDVRQDPTNPLVLQKTTDGGETWVDFADMPPQTRVRQTIIDPCTLQYSLTGGIGDDAWQPFAGLQLCPPQLRWRGGVLEVYDGDEWIPFEILDPLYDDPPPPNPRPEEAPDDPRCSAAASAAYSYLDLANSLVQILDVPLIGVFVAAGDYAGVVSDKLNFFMTDDWFTNLAANAAFQANTIAYLTTIYTNAGIHFQTPSAELIQTLDLTNPDTRDIMKCAFYCAMSDTGVITSADAFAAIDNAIANDGLAAGWASFLPLFGAGGVNAAISAGSQSVPASDCDCDCPEVWCYTFDFTVDDYDFTPLVNSNGTYGVWSSGDGWQAPYLSAVGSWNLFGVLDLGQETAWTEISAVVDQVSMSPFADPSIYIWNNATNDTILGQLTSAGEQIYTVSAVDGARYLRISLGANAATLKSIILRGDGTNPFGADNCE